MVNHSRAIPVKHKQKRKVQKSSQPVSGSEDFYAMQRAIRDPSAATLTPNAVIQLQRTIGNQAVQNLLASQQQSNIIQMSRSYNQAEGNGSGGGGLAYKMIQGSGYHIKFHPRGGNDGLFFDEFHITFEDESTPDGNPKIYFDTQGNRLEKYDNTRVNRAYRSSYGGKRYNGLIDTAKQYAARFLNRCDEIGVVELDSKAEASLKEAYELEQQERQSRIEQEEQQFGDQRRQHDKKQLTNFASDSRGLFAQQTDEIGQQILDIAGITKGMKSGQLAPWIYVPLKLSLNKNETNDIQKQLDRIEDNTIKQKIQDAMQQFQ